MSGDKPVMTYRELQIADAKHNMWKIALQTRIEHVRDGCPLERGALGCVVCEVP